MAITSPKKDNVTSVFLKKNWQVVYALVLIILVPTTIVLNTFLVIDRFRSTVDAELQRTALLIGKMINVTSLDILDDVPELQQRLEAVAATVQEAKTLDILAKEGEDFKVVASLSKEDIGKTAHGRQNILTWYDGRAIAYLTKSGRSAASEGTLTPAEARGEERYWGVVMPISDAQGNLKYLLSSKISLNVIDQMVRTNLFWSYIWLIITVLIVILLLMANTRMFEYAVLFRKLKEVDQMKDDFISMASHELRAPITAIRGYLSLFLEDAFGKLDDKPKNVMKTTFALTTHLATLVEDLLEVSRIEQGRMSMSLEPLQPEELIQEILDQLHFEAEKKQLAFDYRRPEQPLPKIMADRSRLKQVLINLCSNAIKYTPKGSVLITSEMRDKGMLEIKVTDTGLGMSAEAREKLFQKFYRVKTDETRTIPGTGLGLWITKQIVELMKGKIFCDSIEKVGTQMSVLLPTIPQAAPSPAAEPTSKPTETKPTEQPSEKKSV